MTVARDWFGDGSVFVVDVPLACCALETQAAARGVAVPVAAVPETATLVVTLSGTITEPVVPAIRATLEAMPRTPVVVAFGGCACIGGPYWDSYAVRRGAGDLTEVDHFIAGCPPPPSALASFLDDLRDAAVAS